MSDKIISISDTIHGTIQISNIEYQIVSTDIFNRLHSISQNSTAYLTFPSNRTKRFEHSLGTMYLAGRMFYYSVANADETCLFDFINNAKRQIEIFLEQILKNPNTYRHILGDCNLSDKKIHQFEKFEKDSRIYNIWVPANVDSRNEFVFLTLMQSIRLAALLHDVGHPPFSHISESALQDVWKEVDEKDENIRTDNEKDFYSTLSRYFSDEKNLHEEIGNAIADNLLVGLLKPIAREDLQNDKVIMRQVFLILIKMITLSILNDEGSLFRSLHSLIDGSLDSDRLDYVSRDVMNSGFSNGLIEYERLISSIKLDVNGNEDYVFALNSKVINNVEDFFVRRWKLYKQIIYHHRVVKTDFLLKICIEDLLKISLTNQQTKDSEEKILPYDISGLWIAVKELPSISNFFEKLIQWDDNWLLVILKKEYFEMETEDDTIHKLLKVRLKELLENKKYYYSVIKRPKDFDDIELEVLHGMREKIGNYERTMEKINCAANTNHEIAPFIKDMTSLIKNIQDNENPQREKGFFTAKVRDKFFDNYFPTYVFIDLVKNAVKNAGQEVNNVKEAIAEFKNVKTGVNESLLLYSSSMGLEPFTSVSGLPEVLKKQKNILPPFYVYIARDDEEQQVDYGELKKKIGRYIVEELDIKINALLLNLKGWD